MDHDSKYDDLPAVILDVGQKGMKKTRLCGIYREYKGGVSGLDTCDAQLERMQRITELWESTIRDKEYIITGDLNVDWKRVNDPGYQNSAVAKKLIDFTITLLPYKYFTNKYLYSCIVPCTAN